MKLAVSLGTAYYLMNVADITDPGNRALEANVGLNPTEATCRSICDGLYLCNQYVWKSWATNSVSGGVLGRCWVSPVLLGTIAAGTSNSYPTAMIVISGQKKIASAFQPTGPFELCNSLNAQLNSDPCFTSYTRLISGVQPIGIPYIIALAVKYDTIVAGASYKIQLQSQTDTACRLSCSYNPSCFQYIFQKDSTSLATTCYNLPYIVGVTLYSNQHPSLINIVVGEKAWSLSSPSLSAPAGRKNIKTRTSSPGVNQYYATCVSSGLSQAAGTETTGSTCATAYQKLAKAKLCALKSPLSSC